MLTSVTLLGFRKPLFAVAGPQVEFLPQPNILEFQVHRSFLEKLDVKELAAAGVVELVPRLQLSQVLKGIRECLRNGSALLIGYSCQIAHHFVNVIILTSPPETFTKSAAVFPVVVLRIIFAERYPIRHDNLAVDFPFVIGFPSFERGTGSQRDIEYTGQRR